MKKRFLSLFLAAGMVMTMFPAAALAAEETEEAETFETRTIEVSEETQVETAEEAGAEIEMDLGEAGQSLPAPADDLNNEVVSSGQCGDDLTWTIDDAGVLTISGTGDMWDYTFLSSDTPPWWNKASSISSVVIEEGVTSIGDYAFYTSTNTITYATLRRVSLPETLKYIGHNAFSKCPVLTTVIIPESVTQIDYGLFSQCSSLKNVTLPSTLKSISASMFSGCSKLANITIPEGVTSIGNTAFYQCTSLAEITIPSKVTSIGELAMAECSSLSQISFLGSAPVTIGTNPFQSVTATVSYIDDGTWTDSVRSKLANAAALTWVSIPGGQCGDNLKWILQGSTLTISGTGDMWDYSSDYPGWYGHATEIRSVVVEEGTSCIGDYAFYSSYPGSYTMLTNVELPDGMVRLGENCFRNCSLIKQIGLPESLTVLGKYAFNGCTSLNNIMIPEGVTRIEECTFSGCKALSDITLPDTLAYIGSDAFNTCTALTRITFPESLTTISRYAFSYCTGLESITVPAAVKSIGDHAFGSCEALKKITFHGSAPTLGEECFLNVTATAYYQDDGTWTEDVKQDYGGTITWESLEPAELILYKDYLELAVNSSEKLEVNTGAPLIWTSDNETVATVDDSGVVTACKYGKAKITVTTQSGMASATCDVQTLFWDVADSSKYYFRHVYWAAEKGITKGYNLEYFDPQGVCTREQMMTFLWRLAGQPAPKSTKSPFPDVTKSDYFYKAVLWGVENKITNGYSEGEYAGKFGVGLPCTREQAMTFLWRMAGKPAPGTNVNPFSDIRSTDYFYKAVLWASKNGIANGYADGTYGYGVSCLREHMVTFLSRYASKFMK